MSGSTRKGGKAAPPAPAGRTSAKDIAATSWVLVPSPGEVPSRSSIEVDGDSDVMETDVARPLSIGRHSFRVVTSDAAWEATAQIGAGGGAGNPVRVSLGRAGATTRSLAVLRASGSPDAGSIIAATGKPADVRTVVYVHGIGNKPVASVLRCQWDTALFAHDMGDRSRMAYWVDRDRYPRPLDATCGDGDLVAPDDDEASTAAILSLGTGETRLFGAARENEAIQRTIDALTPDEERRATLRSIAEKAIMAADARAGTDAVPLPGGTSARILPFGEETRRMLARLLTRAFLPDVHDFMFDAAKRQHMTDALRQRLQGGGEPFIVVAHSQGSMIAYDVLRSLRQQDCKVPLFITIGSPLGLQELKDHFAQSGELLVPECVDRWFNFADPLDPVAFDPTLADDYKQNGHGAVIQDVPVHNLDSPLHPHSGTGYLALDAVRSAVRDVAGLAFVQRLSGMVVARNVAALAEDDERHVTQDVLIQLADTDDLGVPRPLKTLADELVSGLRGIAQHCGRTDMVEPDIMRRFVSAKLTLPEIDGLRTLSEQLHVKQVWANAKKRTLIGNSAATVQVTPARLGYSATGADIGWAVLDTGIDEYHPHFSTHKNIRGQWDCLAAGAPRALLPGGNGLSGWDLHGHGTHVAGIIAGGMERVMVGTRTMPLIGMAPEAGLYSFRVLGKDGSGNDAAIIKALDMIAGMNEASSSLVIHGVNLSLGSNFDPSVYGCGHTPLCQELRRLWQQGVLVCLAAGNEGYAELRSLSGVIDANMALSIGDPANLEEAIAVGSVHKLKPHSFGVSYFSSRGPTADGRRKPDLVAPGERVLSALAGGRPAPGTAADAVPKADSLYVEMSGTSMAAPHVSGLLAAFLSVRREFIGDPGHTKEVLLGACTDLRRDANMQGAGLANLVKMLLET